MKAKVGDDIRIIKDGHYCQFLNSVFKITRIEHLDRYYCDNNDNIELVWFEHEFVVLSRRKKLDRILK